MGRTKRKRSKRPNKREFDDLSNVYLLQESMRLKCPNIKIHHFNETGRGLRCKKKIEKGDTLISLPLCNLITPRTRSDIFSFAQFSDVSPQFVLSIILVYEAHLKTESRYFNYIETIPKDYTNLYFCTSQEKNLLPECMQSLLNPQTAQLSYHIAKLFEIFGDKRCHHCGEKLRRSIYTKEKFIWAWFTVNTRSVYYEEKNKAESLALAPFLDLFNHSNDADIQQCIDFKNQLYILKTLVGYKKHDQVFIKYGPHSNLKLLVEYGFIGPENPHDVVEFSLLEIISIVQHYLTSGGRIFSEVNYKLISSNKLDQNLTKSEEFSWNFNALIYLLITEDKEQSLMQSKIYSNNFNESEMKVIKKVGDILTERKLNELHNNLLKMETIKVCSESFQLAKNLMRIYIKLLKN